MTAVGIAQTQGRAFYAHSVLTCCKNAEGAASQPQLHNHANDSLKQIVSSLKVCLSGLAMHIRQHHTLTGLCWCSSRELALGVELLHLGRMQGDESEIQQLHQIFVKDR